MIIAAIFDKKACTYSILGTYPNREVAKREFANTFVREGIVAKFPSDFSFCEIGHFNDLIGEIEPCVPVVFMEALELFGGECIEV